MKAAAAILRDLRCPFIINQNRFSIFDRTIERNGLLAAAREEKKGIIAFSPLEQGLLTNRYLNGIPEDSRVRTDGRFLKETSITEEKLAKIRRLHDLAHARGETLAQMALAWVMSKEGVTSVLIGASKPEQIVENVEILRSAPFTEEELIEIDQIVLAK